jgi:hypothetical protein
LTPDCLSDLTFASEAAGIGKSTSPRPPWHEIVVYTLDKHTCEADEKGPTYSLRVIDNLVCATST